MKTIAAGLLALAASLASVPAQAATIRYADAASIVVDGPRGTSNGRADITASLGSTLSAPGAPSFFELGYGAIVDFTFGGLFRDFVNISEVTFGKVASLPESVIVQLGRGGVFTTLATLSNLDSQGAAGATLTFAGRFDTVRLIDTSPVRGRTGGFDVDRIAVAAVPLPAGGMLLLGALGALALGRRRRA